MEPHGLGRARADPAVHGPDHDGHLAERRIVRELPPAGHVRGVEYLRRRVLRPVPGRQRGGQRQVGHDVLQQPPGVPNGRDHLVLQPADRRLGLRVQLS